MKSASHSGGSPGIVIVPGAIAFTRTMGANSFARIRVIMTTPAFETEWGRKFFQPSNPPMSAKLITTPLPDFSRNGAAAWAQKNGAFKFVSSDEYQLASVV